MLHGKKLCYLIGSFAQRDLLQPDGVPLNSTDVRLFPSDVPLFSYGEYVREGVAAAALGRSAATSPQIRNTGA